jgi:SAM-dependent methyltransferase
MSDSLRTELGSPERYGYAWDEYSEIMSEYEEQFQRWTAPLKPADWRGVRFLDGGCGIGRNSYWPMTYGAAGGLAIDLDPRTLDHARRNLAGFPSVEVRQQSLYDLTERSVFDVAFSIGVILTLEFPDKAVERMTGATKPGGVVLVWVYGRENNGWIVNIANPLRVGLFSRLPLSVVHAISLPITAGLWLALRLGVGRIEYFRQLRRLNFRHQRSIVFDHMIPKIARYYRREEAIDLLKRAGLEDVKAFWVNEMSWTVIGRKPTAHSR